MGHQNARSPGMQTPTPVDGGVTGSTLGKMVGGGDHRSDGGCTEMGGNDEPTTTSGHVMPTVEDDGNGMA
jgi:hypothetical protein